MSNWTRHLPQLGVLAMSAALAAGAYSVYAGQTGGSTPATGETAAGLTLESPSGAVPAARSRDRERHGKSRHEARGHELASLAPVSTTTGPSSAAPAILPAPAERPASSPSERDPDSRPGAGDIRDPGSRDRRMIDEENLGGRQLDQELQEIGQGAPPVAPLTPQPAPSEPAPDDQPEDAPADPGATPDDQPEGVPADPGATPSDPAAPPEDEPVDVPSDPGATPPATDPGTSPPATQPDPSGGVDPDAGLDDTPAGGLDQTDLGTQVDEPPAAATGAAATAPRAP